MVEGRSKIPSCLTYIYYQITVYTSVYVAVFVRPRFEWELVAMDWLKTPWKIKVLQPEATFDFIPTPAQVASNRYYNYCLFKKIIQIKYFMNFYVKNATARIMQTS